MRFILSTSIGAYLFLLEHNFKLENVRNKMEGAEAMNRSKKNVGQPVPYKNESKLAKMLDIPMSLLPDVFHLEFSGNREATLTGCTGIQEYEEGVITIGAGKISVRFCGNIQIRSMTEDAIVLEGVFHSVTFLPASEQKS